MAQATTRRFGQFKIYVGDGATPEVFAAPCGFTEKALKISKDMVDSTVPDCDDPDAATWVGRDVRTISLEVSGSGMMAMESLAIWRAWALSDDPKNIRVEVSGTGAQGGGYFAVAAHLSEFEITASFGDKAQVSVTLPSTGAATWTDAA